MTSLKEDGSYNTGTVISIRVQFSEPVTVVGIPTLRLETGTNDAIAYYKQKATDGNTLIFEYIVAAGHTSNDLNYSSTTALTLPTGASIKATSTTTNANLTLPALASVSSLAGSKALRIDTTRPIAPARPHVPAQADVTIFRSNSSTIAPTTIANRNDIDIVIR